MIPNNNTLPGPPVPVPATNVSMHAFGGRNARFEQPRQMKIQVAQITTAVQQALRDVAATKDDAPAMKLLPVKTPSLMDVVKWQTQQKQLDRKVIESTTKPKEKELAGKVADVDKVLASAPAMKAVDDPRCKFVSRLDALAAVKDNKQREAIAELTYKQFGPQSKTPCVYMKSSDEMKKQLTGKAIEGYKEHYKQEIAKSGSVAGEPLKLATASLQLPAPLSVTSTAAASATTLS
jgi:hypothetical protein